MILSVLKCLEQSWKCIRVVCDVIECFEGCIDWQWCVSVIINVVECLKLFVLSKSKSVE